MSRTSISGDLALKAKLEAMTPDNAARISDGDGPYLRPFVEGRTHGWRFDHIRPTNSRNTLSLVTFPQSLATN
jgi:hypothetical protein